ncbi:MAG: PHP domain-containing protein [Chloroflexi bacterium]|nr:PHP domain-containing protein [Chloroflexota bacterium]
MPQAEAQAPRYQAQVDLHLHTTASDGRLAPQELVRLVAQRGLKVVAITDHDSTAGLAEARAEAALHPGLTLVPGVELSTDIPSSEVHLLGYFVDEESQEFQQLLEHFRHGREVRARRMVEKLNELGIQIAWERVVELAGGGAIGRPHIAQAMVERGYVTYPQDAFARYIGRNGPAYVEREKLTPEEAVPLLIRHGGLPVLAHPIESGNGEPLLTALKQIGLVGVEVYYGHYTPEQVELLLGLANKLDLVPCGGSDYHALGTPGEVEPGMVGPPLEVAHRLLALAGGRRRQVRH